MRGIPFIRTILFAGSLALSIQVAHAATGAPEQLYAAGLKSYKAGDFQQGLEAFSTALTNLAGNADIDPSRLQYNIGIGHYRLQQPDEAIAAFTLALLTPDIALQQSTYYNLGNVIYQQAQKKLDEGDIAPAFQQFEKAASQYIQAMRLDPDDLDAKVNYELSRLAQNRILQMVAMALSRMKQGQQLVGEYRFVEAAQWFQQNLPMVEKALSMKPEQQKMFKTMSERTSSVAGILAPQQPGAQPGGTP